MNLHELAAQISSWGGRKVESTSVLSADPQQAYSAVVEREFLKKGKVMLKRFADLQERLQLMQIEAEVIKTQLLQMQQEMITSLDLPSGDQVQVELSKSPVVQAFWQEASFLLERISLHQGEKVPVQRVSSLKLYDPAFLAQESDDLINYL
jgi:hypothetical protein